MVALLRAGGSPVGARCVKQLIVAIHDVSPQRAPTVVQLRELVERREAGPVSVLLVPRLFCDEPWAEGHFSNWVATRAAMGDELVLHGYTHVSQGLRNEHELAALSATEIETRIALGRSELGQVGLATCGFIAPCYLHPSAAHVACERAGLAWWATRNMLHRPAGRLFLPSLGLGASSAFKRATSPSVARFAALAVASSPWVRLDLHPADLDHEMLRRAATDLLERLLDQGRTLTTHSQLAVTWPPNPKPQAATFTGLSQVVHTR
jgi:uncharacterized protein